MAEKVVKSSDIIEDDVFRPTRESAEKTLPVLLKMQDVFESFLKATKEQVKGNGGIGIKPEEYDETLAKVKEVAKAHVKLKEDIVRTQAQVAAAYDEEAKALRDNKVELAAATLARNELNKEARQAAILAKAEEGSLEMLRVKLSQATKALDAMSAATLKTQRGMEQITLVKNLNQQISEVEQASGRFQRNVGNYKSATDGLSLSIAQITRETPSAAISLNTYFMAISNNLPMFTDQIKKLRDLNKELADSGQPTVSVIESISKAFFSWQTLLSAGITLLTFYGQDIINFITGTKKATEAQDEFNKSLEQANKDYKTLADRAEDARIRILEATGQISAVDAERLALQKQYLNERNDINKNEYEAFKKFREDYAKSGYDSYEEYLNDLRYGDKQFYADYLRTKKVFDDQRAALDKEFQERSKLIDINASKEKQKAAKAGAKEKVNDAAKEYSELLKLADDTYKEAVKTAQNERHEVTDERDQLNEDLQKAAERLAKEQSDAAKEEYARAKKQMEEADKEAKDRAEKAAKDKAEREKKERQERIKSEQQAFDELNKSLQYYYDRREYLLDKTIDNSKRRQDELRTLAALGVQDAKDSLATEQKIQAEAEQKKLELERKKARAELGTAAFKSYTAHVENGDKNAVAATIKDIVMLSAFIQSLPAFYEGTENTGTGGGMDGKGGFLSVLHPNERVMTAEQNGMVGTLSNMELANLAQMYNMGLVAPRVTYETDRTDAVIHELRSVKDAIKSIDIPAQKVYFDETTKALVNVVETRTKVIKTHHKTGGIWG